MKSPQKPSGTLDPINQIPQVRPGVRTNCGAELGLFLLVGVEDRGDALGIGGERLDAGALDLQ
jgi:hypothetical protein